MALLFPSLLLSFFFDGLLLPFWSEVICSQMVLTCIFLVPSAPDRESLRLARIGPCRERAWCRYQSKDTVGWWEVAQKLVRMGLSLGWLHVSSVGLELQRMDPEWLKTSGLEKTRLTVQSYFTLLTLSPLGNTGSLVRCGNER